MTTYASLNWNAEEQRAELTCNCESNATMAWWDDLFDGFVYTTPEGEDHLFTSKVWCPDCKKEWYVPSAKRAEAFIQEQHEAATLKRSLVKPGTFVPVTKLVNFKGKLAEYYHDGIVYIVQRVKGGWRVTNDYHYA